MVMLLDDRTARASSLPKPIVFVAASVIVPSSEPLVKIPLRLVPRHWAVVRLGLVSTCGGYLPRKQRDAERTRKWSGYVGVQD